MTRGQSLRNVKHIPPLQKQTTGAWSRKSCPASGSNAYRYTQVAPLLETCCAARPPPLRLSGWEGETVKPAFKPSSSRTDQPPCLGAMPALLPCELAPVDVAAVVTPTQRTDRPSYRERATPPSLVPQPPSSSPCLPVQPSDRATPTPEAPKCEPIDLRCTSAALTRYTTATNHEVT
jgi:hypothetical protein